MELMGWTHRWLVTARVGVAYVCLGSAAPSTQILEYSVTDACVECGSRPTSY